MTLRTGQIQWILFWIAVFSGQTWAWIVWIGSLVVFG